MFIRCLEVLCIPLQRAFPGTQWVLNDSLFSLSTFLKVEAGLTESLGSKGKVIEKADWNSFK